MARWPSRAHIMPNHLDEFTLAYITTALWSSTDETTESGGYPLDDNYGPEDIAPDTLAAMASDCAEFQRTCADDITAAIETGKVRCGPDYDAMGRAGHDFWLTRNGHGAGFWDGDWPEPYASRLSDAAIAHGSRDLYVGDDNRIHQS